jgi:hypothetical protein
VAALFAAACWSNSANLALSTDVEPSKACATSGIIWIVIIGTDEDEPSVVNVGVIRVNGAIASKSWAFVKLIVTRLLFPLLLFESNRVAADRGFISAFGMLRVLAVVIGKREDFFVHTWRCNTASNWFFVSFNCWIERSRLFWSSINTCSIYLKGKLE